ncbi:MAG: hypothetical protein HY059_09515 [Proteobacteria bacterium]|nr:hypothetical protein [Pseudomonadota bacterium]
MQGPQGAIAVVRVPVRLSVSGNAERILQAAAAVRRIREERLARQAAAATATPNGRPPLPPALAALMDARPELRPALAGIDASDPTALRRALAENRTLLGASGEAVLRGVIADARRTASLEAAVSRAVQSIDGDRHAETMMRVRALGLPPGRLSELATQLELIRSRGLSDAERPAAMRRLIEAAGALQRLSTVLSPERLADAEAALTRLAERRMSDEAWRLAIARAAALRANDSAAAIRNQLDGAAAWAAIERLARIDAVTTNRLRALSPEQLERLRGQLSALSARGGGAAEYRVAIETALARAAIENRARTAMGALRRDEARRLESLLDPASGPLSLERLRALERALAGLDDPHAADYGRRLTEAMDRFEHEGTREGRLRLALGPAAASCFEGGSAALLACLDGARRTASTSELRTTLERTLASLRGLTPELLERFHQRMRSPEAGADVPAALERVLQSAPAADVLRYALARHLADLPRLMRLAPAERRQAIEEWLSGTGAAETLLRDCAAGVASARCRDLPAAERVRAGLLASVLRALPALDAAGLGVGALIDEQIVRHVFGREVGSENDLGIIGRLALQLSRAGPEASASPSPLVAGLLALDFTGNSADVERRLAAFIDGARGANANLDGMILANLPESPAARRRTLEDLQDLHASRSADPAVSGPAAARRLARAVSRANEQIAELLGQGARTEEGDRFVAELRRLAALPARTEAEWAALAHAHAALNAGAERLLGDFPALRTALEAQRAGQALTAALSALAGRLGPEGERLDAGRNVQLSALVAHLHEAGLCRTHPAECHLLERDAARAVASPETLDRELERERELVRAAQDRNAAPFTRLFSDASGILNASLLTPAALARLFADDASAESRRARESILAMLRGARAQIMALPRRGAEHNELLSRIDAALRPGARVEAVVSALRPLVPIYDARALEAIERGPAGGLEDRRIFAAFLHEYHIDANHPDAARLLRDALWRRLGEEAAGLEQARYRRIATEPARILDLEAARLRRLLADPARRQELLGHLAASGLANAPAHLDELARLVAARVDAAEAARRLAEADARTPEGRLRQALAAQMLLVHQSVDTFIRSGRAPEGFAVAAWTNGTGRDVRVVSQDSPDFGMTHVENAADPERRLEVPRVRLGLMFMGPSGEWELQDLLGRTVYRAASETIGEGDQARRYERFLNAQGEYVFVREGTIYRQRDDGRGLTSVGSVESEHGRGLVRLFQIEARNADGSRAWETLLAGEETPYLVRLVRGDASRYVEADLRTRLGLSGQPHTTFTVREGDRAHTDFLPVNGAALGPGYRREHYEVQRGADGAETWRRTRAVGWVERAPEGNVARATRLLSGPERHELVLETYDAVLLAGVAGEGTRQYLLSDESGGTDVRDVSRRDVLRLLVGAGPVATERPFQASWTPAAGSIPADPERRLALWRAALDWSALQMSPEHQSALAAAQVPGWSESRLNPLRWLGGASTLETWNGLWGVQHAWRLAELEARSRDFLLDGGFTVPDSGRRYDLSTFTVGASAQGYTFNAAVLHQASGHALSVRPEPPPQVDPGAVHPDGYVPGRTLDRAAIERRNQQILFRLAQHGWAGLAVYDGDVLVGDYGSLPDFRVPERASLHLTATGRVVGPDQGPAARARRTGFHAITLGDVVVPDVRGLNHLLVHAATQDLRYGGTRVGQVELAHSVGVSNFGARVLGPGINDWVRSFDRRSPAVATIAAGASMFVETLADPNLWGVMAGLGALRLASHLALRLAAAARAAGTPWAARGLGALGVAGNTTHLYYHAHFQMDLFLQGVDAAARIAGAAHDLSRAAVHGVPAALDDLNRAVRDLVAARMWGFGLARAAMRRLAVDRPAGIVPAARPERPVTPSGAPWVIAPGPRLSAPTPVEPLRSAPRGLLGGFLSRLARTEPRGPDAQPPSLAAERAKPTGGPGRENAPGTARGESHRARGAQAPGLVAAGRFDAPRPPSGRAQVAFDGEARPAGRALHEAPAPAAPQAQGPRGPGRENAHGTAGRELLLARGPLMAGVEPLRDAPRGLRRPRENVLLTAVRFPSRLIQETMRIAEERATRAANRAINYEAHLQAQHRLSPVERDPSLGATSRALLTVAAAQGALRRPMRAFAARFSESFPGLARAIRPLAHPFKAVNALGRGLHAAARVAAPLDRATRLVMAPVFHPFAAVLSLVRRQLHPSIAGYRGVSGILTELGSSLQVFGAPGGRRSRVTAADWARENKALDRVLKSEALAPRLAEAVRRHGGEEPGRVTISAAEQNIAMNVAPPIALLYGLRIISRDTGLRPHQIIEAHLQGGLASEHRELLWRLTNATWKGGQYARGSSRITRETFAPLGELSEQILNLDRIQMAASANYMRDALVTSTARWLREHLVDWRSLSRLGAEAQLEAMRAVFESDHESAAAAQDRAYKMEMLKREGKPGETPAPFVTDADRRTDVTRKEADLANAAQLEWVYGVETAAAQLADARGTTYERAFDAIVRGALTPAERANVRYFVMAAREAGHAIRGLDRVAPVSEAVFDAKVRTAARMLRAALRAELRRDNAPPAAESPAPAGPYTLSAEFLATRRFIESQRGLRTEAEMRAVEGALARFASAHEATWRRVQDLPPMTRQQELRRTAERMMRSADFDAIARFLFESGVQATLRRSPEGWGKAVVLDIDDTVLNTVRHVEALLPMEWWDKDTFGEWMRDMLREVRAGSPRARELAVPGVERLDDLRRKGFRIVFLSDNHVDNYGVARDLLTALGIYKGGNPLRRGDLLLMRADGDARKEARRRGVEDGSLRFGSHTPWRRLAGRIYRLLPWAGWEIAGTFGDNRGDHRSLGVWPEAPPVVVLPNPMYGWDGQFGADPLPKRMGRLVAAIRREFVADPSIGTRLMDLALQARVSSEELIAAAERSAALRGAFAMPAGVAEGFTLREHTLMVLREFEALAASDAFRGLLSPADLARMRITILLHDAGKPFAFEAGDVRRQHEATDPLLRSVMQLMGLERAAIERSAALVDNDALGETLWPPEMSRAAALARGLGWSTWGMHRFLGALRRHPAGRELARRLAGPRAAELARVASAAGVRKEERLGFVTELAMFTLSDARSYASDRRSASGLRGRGYTDWAYELPRAGWLAALRSYVTGRPPEPLRLSAAAAELFEGLLERAGVSVPAEHPLGRLLSLDGRRSFGERDAARPEDAAVLARVPAEARARLAAIAPELAGLFADASPAAPTGRPASGLRRLLPAALLAPAAVVAYHLATATSVKAATVLLGGAATASIGPLAIAAGAVATAAVGWIAYRALAGRLAGWRSRRVAPAQSYSDLDVRLAKVAGTPEDVVEIGRQVRETVALEERMLGLSNRGLRAKTAAFRRRLKRGESLDQLAPEALAVVREAMARVLKKRQYVEQLAAAAALHLGRATQQATGEGKTLSVAMAAYLHALRGPVDVYTFDSYLATRDAQEIGPVLRALGMTVGAFGETMRDNAFARESGWLFSSMGLMNPHPAAAVFAEADVIYTPRAPVIFAFLRDSMASSRDAFTQRRRAQRFAIFDEGDALMLSNTSFRIVDGTPDPRAPDYAFLYRMVENWAEGVDFVIDRGRGALALSDKGREFLESLRRVSPYYAEMRHLEEYVTNALRAKHLLRVDHDYSVTEDGRVIIVSRETGRPLPGMAWDHGLHRFVEIKEGVALGVDDLLSADIGLTNFIRRYERIAAISGTIVNTREFRGVYSLAAVVVPPHRESIRRDLAPVGALTHGEKLAKIAAETAEARRRGQAVLIGTDSIVESAMIAERLREAGVPFQSLNGTQEKGQEHIIREAGLAGAVTVGTQLVGRGIDIAPEPAVLRAGGLHVAAAGLGESRSIDMQLRGRAGRQGNPGSSRLFFSLEDNIIARRATAAETETLERYVRTYRDGRADVPAEAVERILSGIQERSERDLERSRERLRQVDDNLAPIRAAYFEIRDAVHERRAPTLDLPRLGLSRGDLRFSAWSSTRALDVLHEGWRAFLNEFESRARPGAGLVDAAEGEALFRKMVIDPFKARMGNVSGSTGILRSVAWELAAFAALPVQLVARLLVPGPLRATFHYASGRLSYWRGDHAAAVASFDRALASMWNVEGFSGSRTFLARGRANLRVDDEAAIRNFIKVLELGDKGSPSAIARRRRAVAEIAGVYERRGARMETNGDALGAALNYRLVRDLVGGSRWEKALERMRPRLDERERRLLMAEFPFLSPIFLFKARESVDARDFERAAYYFERVLAVDPTAPAAHFGRAFALRSLGRAGEAVAAEAEGLRRLILGSTQIAGARGAYRRLNSATLDPSALDRAIDARALVAGRPDRSWKRTRPLPDSLAWDVRQSKGKQGVRFFNWMLRIDPQSAEALEGRAIALSAVGSHAEAIGDYLSSLKYGLVDETGSVRAQVGSRTRHAVPLSRAETDRLFERLGELMLQGRLLGALGGAGRENAHGTAGKELHPARGSAPERAEGERPARGNGGGGRALGIAVAGALLAAAVLRPVAALAKSGPRFAEATAAADPTGAMLASIALGTGLWYAYRLGRWVVRRLPERTGPRVAWLPSRLYARLGAWWIETPLVVSAGAWLHQHLIEWGLIDRLVQTAANPTRSGIASSIAMGAAWAAVHWFPNVLLRDRKVWLGGPVLRRAGLYFAAGTLIGLAFHVPFGVYTLPLWSAAGVALAALWPLHRWANRWATNRRGGEDGADKPRRRFAFSSVGAFLHFVFGVPLMAAGWGAAASSLRGPFFDRIVRFEPLEQRGELMEDGAALMNAAKARWWGGRPTTYSPRRRLRSEPPGAVMPPRGEWSEAEPLIAILKNERTSVDDAIGAALRLQDVVEAAEMVSPRTFPWSRLLFDPEVVAAPSFAARYAVNTVKVMLAAALRSRAHEPERLPEAPAMHQALRAHVERVSRPAPDGWPFQMSESDYFTRKIRASGGVLDPLRAAEIERLERLHELFLLNYGPYRNAGTKGYTPADDLAHRRVLDEARETARTAEVHNIPIDAARSIAHVRSWPLELIDAVRESVEASNAYERETETAATRIILRPETVAANLLGQESDMYSLMDSLRFYARRQSDDERGRARKAFALDIRRRLGELQRYGEELRYAARHAPRTATWLQRQIAELQTRLGQLMVNSGDVILPNYINKPIGALLGGKTSQGPYPMRPATVRRYAHLWRWLLPRSWAAAGRRRPHEAIFDAAWLTDEQIAPLLMSTRYNVEGWVNVWKTLARRVEDYRTGRRDERAMHRAESVEESLFLTDDQLRMLPSLESLPEDLRIRLSAFHYYNAKVEMLPGVELLFILSGVFDGKPGEFTQVRTVDQLDGLRDYLRKEGFMREASLRTLRRVAADAGEPTLQERARAILAEGIVPAPAPRPSLAPAAVIVGAAAAAAVIKNKDRLLTRRQFWLGRRGKVLSAAFAAALASASFVGYQFLGADVAHAAAPGGVLDAAAGALHALQQFLGWGTGGAAAMVAVPSAKGENKGSEPGDLGRPAPRERIDDLLADAQLVFLQFENDRVLLVPERVGAGEARITLAARAMGILPERTTRVGEGARLDAALTPAAVLAGHAESRRRTVVIGHARTWESEIRPALDAFLAGTARLGEKQRHDARESLVVYLLRDAADPAADPEGRVDWHDGMFVESFRLRSPRGLDAESSAQAEGLRAAVAEAAAARRLPAPASAENPLLRAALRRLAESFRMPDAESLVPPLARAQMRLSVMARERLGNHLVALAREAARAALQEPAFVRLARELAEKFGTDLSGAMALLDSPSEIRAARADNEREALGGNVAMYLERQFHPLFLASVLIQADFRSIGHLASIIAHELMHAAELGEYTAISFERLMRELIRRTLIEERLNPGLGPMDRPYAFTDWERLLSDSDREDLSEHIFSIYGRRTLPRESGGEVPYLTFYPDDRLGVAEFYHAKMTRLLAAARELQARGAMTREEQQRFIAERTGNALDGHVYNDLYSLVSYTLRGRSTPAEIAAGIRYALRVGMDDEVMLIGMIHPATAERLARESGVFAPEQDLAASARFQELDAVDMRGPLRPYAQTWGTPGAGR